MANKKARLALDKLRQTEPVAYFSKSEKEFVLNILSANKADNKIRTWVIKGDTAEKISEDNLSDYSIERVENVKIGPFRKVAGIQIKHKLNAHDLTYKVFLLPDELPLFTAAISGTELDTAIARLQNGG